MIIKDDAKYKPLKKLYQFHQDRFQYDNLFHMMLPKSLYDLFFKHYNIENAKKVKKLLGIVKAILFGLMFLLIFSWAKITDLQILMFYHLFFLWVYITSIAYQIHMKNSISKNDILMLMMSKYRKQLFIDEIKEKFNHSYFTSLMPLTLIPVFIFSVNEQVYLPIFGFILFQIAGYAISKFVIMNLYKLKYITHRHSFFKDFFASILFTLMSGVIYLIFLYPLFFITSDEPVQLVYPLLIIYVSIIIIVGTLIFNSWINKFLDLHMKSILYPKAMSLKQSIKAKYFQNESIALKGLDDIEKAIVIKDQKMFKRSNRKEYYGSYFYGVFLIFSGIPYASRINEANDVLDLISISMIFSGIAFAVHMINTALISKHISYTSEKTLVLTYQRLSVSTKQIFNAKLRMFSYLLLPILILYTLLYLLVLVHFSLDKLWIFLFGIFYFVGLSRLKLRNYLHLDTQNKNAYVNAFEIETSTMGNSIMIGIAFVFFVPLGFVWLANQGYDAFGIISVYAMMIAINLIIWVLNIINDIHIKKVQKEDSL
jgi:hypothetical protein